MKPLRIMVVDDHKDNADSFAKVLRLAGHEVEIAYSGDEAFGKTDPCPFDVIFVDLAMPSVDGCTLLTKIKSDARCADSVFIALTGFVDDAHKRKSLEAGFHFYLTKPVDISRLHELLSQVKRPD
jgi:CheY-like chemotaxis protein